jgi:hypothetical protein
MKMRLSFSLLLAALLASGLGLGIAGDAKKSDAGWTPLFNGRDLSGWDTWLGRPEGGQRAVIQARAYAEAAKLPTDQRQKILDSLEQLSQALKEPIGLNRDPLEVYKVAIVDGQPAIRISGQVFGAITSRDEFENYHIKLEFKWGTKKWPPREDAVRDSGLLYHCVGKHGAAGTFWMRSQECQIQEKDCGDYWSVAGGIVDVEGERAGGKGPVVFKRGGQRFTVPSKEAGGLRIVKSPDNERPTGQWNTVEVLCHGGTSVHVINGKVNMILTNSRQLVDGKEVPLTRGKIQIQSEGAEVFYRNIAFKQIDRIPEEYLK